MPWTVRRQVVGLALLLGIALLAFITAPDVVLGYAAATLDDPVRFAGFLVLLYLFRPVLAMPTMVAAAIVGFAYGILLGIPIALLGTTLSSLPPYVLGKRFHTTEGVLGRWCSAGEQYLTVTGDTRGIVAARLAPLPSDAISYGAGLSGAKTGPFLLGTAIGEFHWTVIAVVAGASARHLVAEPFDAISPLIVVLAVLAAILVILGPIYRHYAHRSVDPLRAE